MDDHLTQERNRSSILDVAYRRTPAVQQRLDALRDRLLDAAIAQVAEHGYGECSISAIAARAEVGTGTLYRQFASKGDLFAEVFRIVCSREVSAATTAGNRARDTDGRAIAAVAAAVTTFAERALHHPVLAYALLVEPVDPKVDTERLLFREAFRDALASAIQLAVESGEIPAQDPTISAAGIVGAIGEALVAPLARGTADSAIVPAMITFTLRALGSSCDCDAKGRLLPKVGSR